MCKQTNYVSLYHIECIPQMKVQVFIMKVQAFMIQVIVVLQVWCSVFASTNDPLLSKPQTLRKSLEGGCQL
jgi:hypothetical protein